MADYGTVTELLIAQPERKLNNLKASILAEMQRLQGELRLVDEALSRKRARSAQDSSTQVSTASTNGNGGRFEGLPAAELLRHVREVGTPVSPAEMRDILASKGIDRTTEAVRTALIRLRNKELLVRTQTGKFAVPHEGPNGVGTEAETGLSSRASFSDGYPPDATDG